jgi:hypothetical protein
MMVNVRLFSGSLLLGLADFHTDYYDEVKLVGESSEECVWKVMLIWVIVIMSNG